MPLPNLKKQKNLTQSTPQAPLETVTSTSPMDIIAINYLKVKKTAGRYEYILVIIDQFTRYAQAYATANKCAKTAAEKLFNDCVEIWKEELRFDRVERPQKLPLKIFPPSDEVIPVKHFQENGKL